MDNDLISREALKKEIERIKQNVEEWVNHTDCDITRAMVKISLFEEFIDLIDNAPTVEALKDIAEVHCDITKEQLLNSLRPQGEWVRKEDVIYSIAKQYSDHNELVPVWLSIGDLKGGAE